jgi:hypothetical protein
MLVLKEEIQETLLLELQSTGTGTVDKQDPSIGLGDLQNTASATLIIITLPMSKEQKKTLVTAPLLPPLL